MPVAVVLGADPATLLAAALPSPKTRDPANPSDELRARAARILAAEAQRHARLVTAVHDLLEKRQERGRQRVIAAAHRLVLAVGGEEELLEVVAADRESHQSRGPRQCVDLDRPGAE